MTAVIRPVGIYDLYFRFGRVSVLALEIIADEDKIFNAHRKALACVIIRYFLIAHSDKSVDSRNGKIEFDFAFERFRKDKIALSALYGVDKEMLYLIKLFVVHALYGINGSALDKRSFAHGKQLNALHRAVRSLVVLTGKIFGHEYFVPVKRRKRVLIDIVYGRLAENSRFRLVEDILFKSFYVVADKHSDAVRGDAENVVYVRSDLLRAHVVAAFFLNKNSLYHFVLSFIS